jgi:hypothetical protein
MGELAMLKWSIMTASFIVGVSLAHAATSHGIDNTIFVFISRLWN